MIYKGASILSIGIVSLFFAAGHPQTFSPSPLPILSALTSPSATTVAAARRFLDRAIALLPQITPADMRAIRLSDIVSAQAMVGDTATALKTIQASPDPNWKAHALRDIAWILAISRRAWAFQLGSGLACIVFRAVAVSPTIACALTISLKRMALISAGVICGRRAIARSRNRRAAATVVAEGDVRADKIGRGDGEKVCGWPAAKNRLTIPILRMDAPLYIIGDWSPYNLVFPVVYNPIM